MSTVAAPPVAQPPSTAEAPLLARLPVTLFATVMGLTGLGLAWHRAAPVLGAPAVIGSTIVVLASALFAALVVIYATKALRHPQAVRAEWLHPVRIALFPAVSISLLLLAAAWAPRQPAIAEVLWLLGATVQLTLTIAIVSAWISRPGIEWANANPAWFIPAVGNVIVPLAGARLGYTELAWLFYAVGLGFWLVLLPIVFARLFFAGPLPERMRPMLFVLIPPPAVALLSYFALGGALDPFARVLYGLAAFFTLFLLARAHWFVRLPFYLSWWGYSFPLAAITVATLAMAERTARPFYALAGAALLALASCVIAFLVVRTVVALLRDEQGFME
jgi:tellurite resistance protein